MEVLGGQWDGGLWEGVQGGIQGRNSRVGVPWRGTRVGGNRGAMEYALGDNRVGVPKGQ